jgi:hypothetical protein
MEFLANYPDEENQEEINDNNEDEGLSDTSF